MQHQDIENKTEILINKTLQTGYLRKEYQSLYETFFQYKEKNPAFYDMALNLIIKRLQFLGIAGNTFYTLSRFWRL